jgi:hypothetical protein
MFHLLRISRQYGVVFTLKWFGKLKKIMIVTTNYSKVISGL